MISVLQIRAARALLGWSQQDLAQAIDLSVTALNQIERGHSLPRPQNLKTIQRVLETAGIEFLPKSGVCLKENTFVSMEGDTCVSYLQNDVYETLAHQGGGEICVMGVTDRHYHEADEKAMKNFLAKARKANMRERVIVEDGDDFFLFPPDFTTYRWLSKKFFRSVPFYAYGNKVAFLVWGPPVRLIIIEDTNLFEAFMGIFELAWDNSSTPPSLDSTFQ